MGARAVTAANDIERDLRARYRQPAGVEQFGIEPVPQERKTVGWFDLFSIMFNFLINAVIKYVNTNAPIKMTYNIAVALAASRNPFRKSAQDIRRRTSANRNARTAATDAASVTVKTPL